MPKRSVKSDSPIPITTALNISALAREHGVSRKTITRRLAKGWRPPAHTPSASPPTSAHSASALSVRALPTGAYRDLPAQVRTPVDVHLRPPLGVVRTVLLLLGVAFYVFIGLAAVHR